MAVNNNTNKVEFIVPLKHLTNPWKTLDIPLIDCEVSLNLPWSKNFVLINMIIYNAVPEQGNVPEIPAINAPTNTKFFKKQHKPVCTSSRFMN